MKVFGLTGGIGMGKSTAGDFLQRRGVPIVDTDILAREVVEPGRPALREIQETFGSQLVDASGRLRRDELARLVFSDSTARRKLEAITHPKIRELWRQQVELWRKEGKPLAVVVIPLLFETGAEADVDATVCIACSPGTQRQRLHQRGWSDDQIQQRNAAQWSIEKKMANATFVVWSEGNVDVLTEQLERIFFKP